MLTTGSAPNIQDHSCFNRLPDAPVYHKEHLHGTRIKVQHILKVPSCITNAYLHSFFLIASQHGIIYQEKSGRAVHSILSRDIFQHTFFLSMYEYLYMQLCMYLYPDLCMCMCTCMCKMYVCIPIMYSWVYSVISFWLFVYPCITYAEYIT